MAPRIPLVKELMKKSFFGTDLWKRIKAEFPGKDDQEILKELYDKSSMFDDLSERNRELELGSEKARDELFQLEVETKKLEKEKKRLICDLNKSRKRSNGLKNDVNELRKKIEKYKKKSRVKKEFVIKEDSELVEELRSKNNKIKKMDLKHQNMIQRLESENRELERTNERLENRIRNIERTHHAVIVKVPANPTMEESEINVIDSRTYYLYKNDPDEINRRIGYDGRIELFKLPSIHQ
ncbi:MAG: hypothetical protein R6V01_09125 [Thermoplasmatota archaeon]